MPSTMITYAAGNRRFNYRVVGLAMHDGRALVHRAAHDSYWTLPGGRGELGETAEQTLHREMREELSSTIEIVRPLWFVENFFEDEGLACHELAVYFLMRFVGPLPFQGRPGLHEVVEGATRFEFQWAAVDRAGLEALPLYPTFLRDRLGALPAGLEHLVHRDV